MLPSTMPIPHTPADLDDGGVRHRIGLILLSTDIATERDFRRMLPDTVGFHTARVPLVNPITPDNLRRMGPWLGQAAATIAEGQRLDVVAYSCPSATVTLGYDAVAARIHEGRPGVAVVTPISAALDAFQALDIRRISLLTPYQDAVTRPMAEYIQARGCEVASVASFRMADDITMARLSPRAIRAAGERFCDPGADALFIACTAMRATETVAALEDALGKPVFTSIQCLAWGALRASGFQGQVARHGRLFRAGAVLS